jgi:c-di-GMP-binding flagellar brake protein YcgR
VDALPDFGQPVTLRDTSIDQEFTSRVDSIEDDGTLVLARPLTFSGDAEFGVGYRCDVIWSADGGVQVLPIEVVENRTEGSVRLWIAKPVGRARREQRRNYVRVPMGTPMKIVFRSNELKKAILVDVSEAGLRARLPADEAKPLDRDYGVQVGFSVDGTGFMIEGKILRKMPYDGATEEGEDAKMDVIITFVIPDRTAADLRRAVFAEQIRQRQMAPEAV